MEDEQQGQNSFSEHFLEYIMPILKIRPIDLIGDDADEFALNKELNQETAGKVQG